MEQEKKYIKKADFFSNKKIVKINQHIDTCLKLIEKLIFYNEKCKNEVAEKLNVEDYIIDFRVEQFDYFHITLTSIYYECFSLKHAYDISALMNVKKLTDRSILEMLDQQRRHVTFNIIVRMFSVFEFCRNDYEKKIITMAQDTKGYVEKIRKLYKSEGGESYHLLRSFRNTIHNNAIWTESAPLEYELREGKQLIKKGEFFKYDHWKLYRIFMDCIDLHIALALLNDPKEVRETRWKTKDGKIMALKVDFDINALLDSLPKDNENIGNS